MKGGWIYSPPGSGGQGCGVGIKAGVGVGRSRPFCSESESELEPARFCRLRLSSGVVGYQPSTDNDSGLTAILGPENMERQEEKESSSVEMKLKRHFVIKCRLINGIGDNFVIIAIVVQRLSY